MSYYLLLKKEDYSLYDTTAYELSKLSSIEKDVARRELNKLEDALNSLEKCANALDMVLSSFEKAQTKIKETKSSDLRGSRKMLIDIDIVVDYVDEETFDIVFLNMRNNEKFIINKLGEYSYKNLFFKYQETLKEIVNYKFDDHFIWRKMNISDFNINKPQRNNNMLTNKRRKFFG